MWGNRKKKKKKLFTSFFCFLILFLSCPAHKELQLSIMQRYSWAECTHTHTSLCLKYAMDCKAWLRSYVYLKKGRNSYVNKKKSTFRARRKYVATAAQDSSDFLCDFSKERKKKDKEKEKKTSLEKFSFFWGPKNFYWSWPDFCYFLFAQLGCQTDETDTVFSGGEENFFHSIEEKVRFWQKPIES